MQILFVVQDQPERRGASGLQGGNSKLHPLFGMSCDFLNLELPFQACSSCQKFLKNYLDAKDWSQPPSVGPCPHCLSWSLQRLSQTSYITCFEDPIHLHADAPGASLFHGPGMLPSSKLIAAWNYSIDMFAIKTCWLESDVKKYFANSALMRPPLPLS